MRTRPTPTLTAPVPSVPGGRVARNRARRSAEFLDVALRIVAEEGLDALTMARLADEVDTAIGAVYGTSRRRAT